MVNYFELAFSKYNRDLNFFSDPFDHIVINNSISGDDIQQIKKEFPEKNFRRTFTDDHRMDWNLDYRGGLTMYNLLCEEFAITEYKQNEIRYDRHMGAGWVHSFGLYTKYAQDKVAGKKVDYPAFLPHRDQCFKIFICLLYLAEPNDSLGGHLEMFVAEPVYGSKQISDDPNIKMVKTIPYAPGTFIIMCNSPNAFHGVGKRELGPYTREILINTFETTNPKWVSRFDV